MTLYTKSELFYSCTEMQGAYYTWVQAFSQNLHAILGVRIIHGGVLYLENYGKSNYPKYNYCTAF